MSRTTICYDPWTGKAVADACIDAEFKRVMHFGGAWSFGTSAMFFRAQLALVNEEYTRDQLGILLADVDGNCFEVGLDETFAHKEAPWPEVGNENHPMVILSSIARGRQLLIGR